jgi:predicted lipoprotein
VDRTDLISARAGLLALVAGLGLLSSGCRIERAVPVEAATAPGGSFANQAFDARAQVVDVWQAKVLPALQQRAGDFPALRAAMQRDLDAAGAAHGHRARGEGAPWNFVTRLKGRIVQADTELSAATAEVDVDGDGQADVTIQIGPVLRGTALRDALPFVSFTDYANQVEFAQLGNAFNDQAAAVALKDLPRERLAGRTVSLLGVFTTADATEAPTILPVQMTLEAL